MPLYSRSVYTSNQIALGSFLGGPIASTLMIRNNFLAAGEIHRARNMMISGLLLSLAIFILVFFLPEQLPRTALPIGYTVGFQALAKSYGMQKKLQIEQGLILKSNWRVLGVSILWFVLSFIIIFALAFALISMGVPLTHHRT